MATCAQLLVFLLLRLCLKAQAALITHTEVVAALGGEASLGCQLTQSEQVMQVTWQKIVPEGSINLATYNTPFGPKVIDGFQGKVEFKAAGLQNNSIIILDVTEQDEGCYCCLFNTYSAATLIGRTCLRLYELQPPVLQLQQSPSGSEDVVSCSATGYPAPTLTLDVSPQRNLSITHGNGSVTVNASAMLSSGSRTSVRCTARVLSYPEMEDVIYFPKVNGSSALVADAGFDWLPLLLNGIIITIIILICVTGIIYKWRRYRNIEKAPNPPLNTESLLQSTEIPIPSTPMRSVEGTDVMATPLYKSVERRSPESTRKRPRKLDFAQHQSPNEKK